jgi:hypothetical protein
LLFSSMVPPEWLRRDSTLSGITKSWLGMFP